ncbi:MAG TPA: imidazole glycerol phosphate synthase subunit HisH [Phycisphaerae bacterium]|nr:imidazole glycerol phosphate synthase subunit HisH [Phycisphaerae bacterium]
MIVIVDYGMGNLRSVQKALERIGQPAVISDKPGAVATAERLIVPGVGAFGDAMAALRAGGLVEAIRDFVTAGRPMLGICLGLQILFEESEEVAESPVELAALADAPLPKGLAMIPGRVQRFSETLAEHGLKVPHMGWNQVRPAGESPLFEGMPDGGVYFYFAHSYYAAPRDEDVVAGWTDYGGPFASAVTSGNVHATQFHPEKSQAMGLALLENFVTRT